MRNLKLLGLALMAMFVVASAFSSFASAAIPLPSVLGIGTTWKGKNIGATLLASSSGGVSVECKKAKGEGTLETSKTLGAFHIHFEECTSPALKVTCTGLSDEAGSILALGTWHSVVDVNEPELHAAILFLVEELHFSCATVLAKVKGDVLCLVVEPLSSKPTHNFECKMEKNSKGEDTGKPTETKYFNDKSELVTIAPLLTSVSEAAFVESAQEGTGTIEFAEAQKFDD